MTDEPMIDCDCQDCDDGCDMVATPELHDEDGEPLCVECSMGSHRQDRDYGSWPQPGDMPNMAGGHEHWDDR